MIRPTQASRDEAKPQINTKRARMDTDQLRVLIRVLCVYLWLKSVANACAFSGFFREVDVLQTKRDVRVEVERVVLSGLQFHCAGGGDHRGVVSREMR